MNETTPFEEDLLSDIRWREKEFIRIKEDISTFESNIHKYNEMIISKNFSDSDRIEKEHFESEMNFFCRLSVPLVYAHWEGFFKHAIRAYLKSISDMDICLSNLTNEIVTYKLDVFMRKLQGKASFSQKKDFVNEYSNKISSIVKFSKGELKIDTKSNLNYEVTKELCEQFVIDNSKFLENEAVINRLVSQRNSICHGENSNVVNVEQIKEYIKIIMDLFYVISEQLSEKLKKQHFLKEVIG
ncbi:MAE_28990/MAE_18760 family HEPN-like nuclease [Pectobacterium polaris]|uniref:MAE_28990/MAE_18760 family HEPN-like nuclease n=1 Tax=Pectobacterium polaris TaxID=2042057 RepID=UPI001583D7DF|nr:MAE_28990/MAE_18760 family HEPN-like nuclease [Pectobacterium polaris]